MKIDTEHLRREAMAQTTQEVFFSIRVADYFRVMEEITGDTNYRYKANIVLAYSDLDEHYAFDFRRMHNADVCSDITIGEMMCAIEKMFFPENYPIKFDPDEVHTYHIRRRAILLLEELLIKPMRHLEKLRQADRTADRSSNEQSLA